jgi:caffeoyl-CoA O-methyltransferase
MEIIDERIASYAESKSTTPSELCNELGEYTKENHPLGHMVCGDLVASTLGFLIKSHKIKTVLEIGTFTGYSALAMAEVLPEDGKIITLDKNKKINKFAKSYWDKSEHGMKIEAQFGEAINILPELLDNGHKFDLVFIDADKRNYVNYLEKSLPLLTDGGIIVVDNVLWSGRVVDGLEGDEPDKSTVYLKEFNDYVQNQPNLYATLLPLRDGLFLIQKA